MAQVDETDNDADARDGGLDQSPTTAETGETPAPDAAPVTDAEAQPTNDPAAEAEAAAEVEATAEAEAAAEADAAAEVKPKKRRRRKRAATAAGVGAAIDAMDTDVAADPTTEAATPAPEETAEPLAPAPVPMMPVDDVEVAARRGFGTRLLLGCLAVVIVLAIGAALGFGAASLVPGFVDASAPVTTLPPATERPTPPPIPTARPSPTASPSPSPVPSPTPLVHTVKRGENLTQIARRYDVTVPAIVEANGITDANRIEVGQKLVIPQP